MQKTISTSISRLVISLVALLLVTDASAQGTTVTSTSTGATAVVPDSLKLFQGVSVGYDLVGAGLLMFSDYGHHELCVRANLKDKYFPVVEVGVGKANHDDDVTGIHYDTQAPYFRVGCDFNLMHQKHSDHKVFAGVRYAFTSYKANIWSKTLTDPVWQTPVDYNITDEKCSQHWAEAIVGIDTKIWGPVHFGWTARYRHRLAHDDGEGGRVWYVPGFGISDSSVLTATFNVSVLLDRTIWKGKTKN
ncbi:MAG: DUF6048 family protein [Prevotellaceae bacterium]|nr:DUF6048 family protein [Prevotellaceae bacterium]